MGRRQKLQTEEIIVTIRAIGSSCSLVDTTAQSGGKSSLCSSPNRAVCDLAAPGRLTPAQFSTKKNGGLNRKPAIPQMWVSIYPIYTFLWSGSRSSPVLHSEKEEAQRTGKFYSIRPYPHSKGCKTVAQIVSKLLTLERCIGKKRKRNLMRKGKVFYYHFIMYIRILQDGRFVFFCWTKSDFSGSLHSVTQKANCRQLLKYSGCIKKERQTDRQTDRQTHTHTHTHTHRRRQRDRDRQTDKQTERQTERWGPVK